MRPTKLSGILRQQIDEAQQVIEIVLGLPRKLRNS
jgi:hypothetical protein